MEDIVTAPFDYSRLDRAGNLTRVRLSSSVRAPLVYTNVLIRNWKSFVNLGLQLSFSL